MRDDWRQRSHELRVTSLGGERFDYLAGIYYSDQTNDFIQSFMFCRGPFALCTGGNTNPSFRGLQRHGWSTLATESRSPTPCPSRSPSRASSPARPGDLLPGRPRASEDTLIQDLPDVLEIPTLDEIGLAFFALLMAFAALPLLRRA